MNLNPKMGPKSSAAFMMGIGLLLAGKALQALETGVITSGGRYGSSSTTILETAPGRFGFEVALFGLAGLGLLVFGFVRLAQALK